MDDDEIMARSWRMLTFTAFGDLQGAAAVLEEIAVGATPRRLYQMARGWCGAAEYAIRQMNGPAPAGTMVAPVERFPGAFAADPHEAFAARMLAAHMNGDDGMCLALFDAVFKASPDDYVASMSALLSVAASSVREGIGS